MKFIKKTKVNKSSVDKRLRYPYQYWFLWFCFTTFVLTVEVLAINAFTVLAALDTWVETFAIFFLTVTFTTVAPFQRWWLCCLLRFHCIVSTFNRLFMTLAVLASLAIALLWAHLSWRKTLTIHFETFCLLASASCLLFFDGGRWADLIFLKMLLQGQLWKLGRVQLLGRMVVFVVEFFCLDECHGHFWGRGGRYVSVSRL